MAMARRKGGEQSRLMQPWAGRARGTDSSVHCSASVIGEVIPWLYFSAVDFRQWFAS
jgi:hypothetical protein